MAGLLVTFGVLCLACQVILAWDRWDRRREAKALAQQRHPANWSPTTEAAIEQAIAIIDDGKSVVAEAERIVRDEADA